MRVSTDGAPASPPLAEPPRGIVRRGDVYPVRGGRGGRTRYLVVVEVHGSTAFCLQYGQDGRVSGACRRATYYLEQKLRIGRADVPVEMRIEWFGGVRS